MRYHANLEGSQQVPPVKTSASGQASFQYHENKMQISYRLNIKSIQRFFVAHIHLGRRGTNGPIIAPLYSGSPSISITQGQIMGSIGQSDLTGPLEGQSVADLAEQMTAGNTYVNVHTEQNPDGEIRGQIIRTDRD